MWPPDDHLAGVELLLGEEWAEDDLAQDLHRLVQAAAVHARGVQEGVPEHRNYQCWRSGSISQRYGSGPAPDPSLFS